MAFTTTGVEQALERRLAFMKAKLEDKEVSDRAKTFALRVEIPRIEAARERLKRGEYGVCESCGEDIGETRLSAIPEVPVCKACERPEPRF